MNNLKTYLTEAYAIDNKSILRILTQNKQINRADPKYSYYDKLANWANSNGKQQKVKNVDLSTIKLSDRGLIEKRKLTTRYTTLGHVLLALKNLMDQNGKYDSSSELSNLIQQTTLEILAGLSGIKDDTTPQKNPEDPEEEDPKKEDSKDDNEQSKPSGNRDWTAYKAKKLANANGEPTSKVLEEFYNEYYKIEYAGLKSAKEEDTLGIVAKLKSLDSILIPEFNKLGYNPEVNPFSQFLKILIKLLKENKSDIFTKLTTNTYGAIHNSFISKYITGNMLGNYDDKNILFCSDLYNYKGLDIVNYLLLQKQTLDSAENNSKYSDNPKLLVAKIFIQQKQLSNNYEKNIDELVKPAIKNIALPSNTSAELRSELEISEIYRYLFKSVPKKELTKAIADKLSEEAEKQNIMLAMIQYLLDLTKLSEQDQKTYEDWFKNFNYTRNEENINSSKEMLSDYIINNKSVELLVSRLKVRVEIKRKKAETK